MSVPVLNEIEMLKAKLHQANLINLQKDMELVKISIQQRQAQLNREGNFLITDFKVLHNTELDFDWNTLKFVEKEVKQSKLKEVLKTSKRK